MSGIGKANKIKTQGIIHNSLERFGHLFLSVGSCGVNSV